MSRYAAARARRLLEVTAPVGWLALVAQTLLEPGANEVPEVGRVILEDGRARLGELVLVPDAPVAIDGRTFELVERAGRFALRIRDPEAPARRAFQGIPCFPDDPRWVVPARLVDLGPRTLTMVYTIGTTGPVPSPGALELELGGRTVRLDAVRLGERLLVVFGDATNGRETYGGGRFLWIDEPVREADFNLAENPACVFSEHALCPLPPPQNRLALRVEAGEQYPRR